MENEKDEAAAVENEKDDAEQHKQQDIIDVDRVKQHEKIEANTQEEKRNR